MTVALIVAAGQRRAPGAGRPKALVELAGRPLLQWSIDALREVRRDREDRRSRCPPGTPAPRRRRPAVDGGAVRSDSVRRALAAAGSRGDPVLVHDAARPLLTAGAGARR